MVILVPISFLLLIALFAGARWRDPREALVRAYLGAFTFILAVTEGASLFHAISSLTFAFAWGLAAAALAIALALRHSPRGGRWGRGCLRAIGCAIPREPLTAALLGVICLGTLATGLLYPPNNWDSMTYHLARVVHWMANGSVRHYATAMGQQNSMAPLAEFAILHLQVLSGSDMFASSVQWMANGMCIVLASLLAAELGGGRQAQALAALVAGTIPMGILQASSTQNDLVVASFCMAFAWSMMRLGRRRAPADWVFCGLALGLAIATKGTAYLYGAAIGGVWGLVLLLRPAPRRQRLERLGGLAAVVALAAALNAGVYVRNVRSTGRPLDTGGVQCLNATHSGFALWHNLVLNAAVNATTPWTAWNQSVERSVRAMFGDRLLDPDLVLPASTFGIVWSRHEDWAGNPIHLLLACLALGLTPLLAGSKRRTRLTYGAMLAGGALLWCLLLRWQPWISRLQMAWFLLATPLVGVTLARLTARRRDVLALAQLLLFAACIPFLFRNASRPLDPRLSGNFLDHRRADLYFTNRPRLREPFAKAVSLALRDGDESIGLYMGANDWEYPLWVLAGQEGKCEAPLFSHVRIDGAAVAGMPDGTRPRHILVTRQADFDGPVRAGYVLEYNSLPIRLYRSGRE